MHADRKAKREAEARRVHGGKLHPICPFCRRKTAHTHAPRKDQPLLANTSAEQDHVDEFEEAIKVSVAATSRGNADEDALIERALRASVRELHSAPESAGSDHEALHRAIQASIAEAEVHQREVQSHEANGDRSHNEAEHQAALERAIQESLLKYQMKSHDDRDDDDEDVRKAVQLSKELDIAKGKDDATSIDNDDEFKLALQRSKESAEKEKHEEEVVLEYVKKQSLLEQKLKESAEVSAEDKSTVNKMEEEVVEKDTEADAEALRLAIQESINSVGSGSKA